jgi:hypothetical protein
MNGTEWHRLKSKLLKAASADVFEITIEAIFFQQYYHKKFSKQE